ncbi:26S proteasome regulatory complex, subunit RPN7/PSMD6, putative, partial [Ixodes scapularis]
QSSVEPMQVDAQPEDNEATEEETYVVENPSLDLEAYSNSYGGLARLYRLLYIADHCTSLRVEALRMALTHVQTTYNITKYQEIHKKLMDAAGASNLPDVTGAGGGAALPPLDSQWIETKSKKAALKLEKLDTDLKNYKSNSIKESIRWGRSPSQSPRLEGSAISHACRNHSSGAVDYCTSSRHVVNMCLNVIKVSVYLQNWSHVLTYVNKAEATPEFVDVCWASRFAALLFVFGARFFVFSIDSRPQTCPSTSDSCDLLYFLVSCGMSQMLSPNNVAMYGGMCALASFDRNELLRNVISSSSFKLFLELEPQLRDIIFKFYESKYATCLTLLNEIKDNLLLDLYLAPHVSTLYTQIRNRALIQYFSPYLSADMTKMASAFNTTVAALEDELMQLILDGQIQARIDSHNKILYAKDIDQRSTTFERALSMGKDYKRRTAALVLRSAMLKNQIHVKSLPRDGSQGADISMTSCNCTTPRN